MKQIILLGDSVRLQYQGAVEEKLADIALVGFAVSGPLGRSGGLWRGKSRREASGLH